MSASGGSDFPRIGDYAFLSDCHTGALVAPDGSVEWMCLPRFDSPSVFTATLDRDAGSFRFGPRGVSAPVARRYEPGTNVLETSWMTETGWVVVTEALTLAERRDTTPVVPGRVPPTHEPEQALVRIAQCVEGEVELEIGCDLRYDYGAKRATWSLEAREGLATATPAAANRPCA